MAVSDDGMAKILSDLWMHQNRRMWDRLQLGATLQAGLLGAAYILTNFAKWPLLTALACLAAMLATSALIHITSVDRAIRNKYRDALIPLGISVGFNPENLDDMSRYNAVSFGILTFLDSKFYMNAVLGGLIAFDAVALGVWSVNSSEIQIRTLTRTLKSLALAKRTFLRDGRHQRAVLLEDHAAGQATPASRAG